MARSSLLTAVNAKLAARGQFLVRKYPAGRHGEPVYCVATGSPAGARYEVDETPIDLTTLAAQLGIGEERAA